MNEQRRALRPERHQVIAFLGPSLPLDEACQRFPGVYFLPPVCQGDLLSAWEMHRPDVIVVIDGEFGQSLSVWHKEILFVLSRGVHVVGASSMGALRAAELERFGMVGVGEVFRHYSGAFLTADEDVALLHGDAEWNWTPLTWPLVNCRATVSALRAAGLDEALGTQLDDALASLHFSQRVEPALADALARQGVADATALARRFAESYVDQKKLDALAGIEHGLQLAGTPVPEFEKPLHLFGRIGESMWETDTLVPSSQTPLRRYELVNDVALHDDEFEALSQRALDRRLALEYAVEAGIEVSDADVADERARFLLTRSITPEILDDWLADNDLDHIGFERLIREEALRRHMQRWVLDLQLYGRNRKLILDQLRLEGRYPEAVRQAARRRSLADARPPMAWPTDPQQIIELLTRHSLSTGWRPVAPVDRLIDDHGFDDIIGMLCALLDAASAREEADARRVRLAAVFGADLEEKRSPSAASAVSTAGAEVDGGALPPVAPSSSPTPRGVDLSADEVASSSRALVREVHRTLESQQAGAVVEAAVALGVFDSLSGPLSSTELAARIDADPGRLERLCVALRAMSLLEGGPVGWSLTSAGALLDDAHPVSLAPYARDLTRVSRPAWARLADIVRGAPVVEVAGDLDTDRAFCAATWGIGMDVEAAALVPAYFGGHVVDFGGGLGRLATTIARRAPRAQVSVVERPEVVERTRAAVAGSRVWAGPLDELPRPADFVVMTRVLLTLPDEQAVPMLRELAARCTPDATLCAVDAVLDGSPGPSMIDLFSLVRSGGGARTEQQWRTLSAASGFDLGEVRPFLPPFSTIYMTRSASGEGAVS